MHGAAGVGRCTAALSLLLIASAASAQPGDVRRFKVGMVETQFHDARRDRPLATRLWYPAADDASEEPLTYDRAFPGRAARDAPALPGSRRPLILLSHGDRGMPSNQAWLAEALAAHGYVVAAVAHWMNTTEQNRIEDTLRVWERPQDLSFVATALLEHPQWRGRLDADRIAAAGHSSGGYTVLALLGAVYAPLRMNQYCSGPDAGPDCGLARGVDVTRIDFSPAGRSWRDARFRAGFVLAPALGPGMTPESLRSIRAPVHIVAARNDEILPFRHHAARYAAEIPGARLEALSDGGHFVFMPRCNLVGTIFTWFHRFDICGRRHAADRGTLHAAVVRSALQFFDGALAPPPAVSGSSP